EGTGWRKVGGGAGQGGRGGKGDVNEWARRGEKHVGVRHTPVDTPPDTAGGRRRAALDQRPQRLPAVAVVVADVEARPRLGGNEIDGLVADVDRREFEIRTVEMLRAVVERLRRQRGDQPDDSAARVVRQLRTGGGALRAGDNERAVLRAAPADLDHVAEALRIGRLAEQAMIELFAARLRPGEQLHRAVDGDALLVAGDQERDRALGFAAARGEMVEYGRDLAGNRAFHVDGAAAIENAVDDLGGERRLSPARRVAGRHDVGMAGEHEM